MAFTALLFKHSRTKLYGRNSINSKDKSALTLLIRTLFVLIFYFPLAASARWQLDWGEVCYNNAVFEGDSVSDVASQFVQYFNACNTCDHTGSVVSVNERTGEITFYLTDGSSSSCVRAWYPKKQAVCISDDCINSCPYGEVYDADLSKCVGPQDCGPKEGNPVEVATGRKSQKFYDYFGNNINITRVLYQDEAGASWGFSVNETAQLKSAGQVQYVELLDGARTMYLKKQANDCWRQGGGSCYQVQVDGDDLLVSLNGEIKRFDSDGRLKAKEFVGQGYRKIEFQYLPKKIEIRSTNELVELDLNEENRVEYLRTPTTTIQYKYTGSGLLEKVVFPDGNMQSFVYADVGLPLLTEMHINQKPFSFWEYDPQGRVTKSWHTEGSDITTFNYYSEEVLVTSPLGKGTRYFFETVKNAKSVTSVMGEPSTNCAAANQYKSYYTNGTLQTQTDWKGNVTLFERDSLGRSTKKTEALKWPATPLFGLNVDTSVLQTTTSTKITQTCWHATYNKPAKIIDPVSVTIFDYFDNGQLKSKKTEARSANNEACL